MQHNKSKVTSCVYQKYDHEPLVKEKLYKYCLFHPDPASSAKEKQKRAMLGDDCGEVRHTCMLTRQIGTYRIGPRLRQVHSTSEERN